MWNELSLVNTVMKGRQNQLKNEPGFWDEQDGKRNVIYQIIKAK